MDLSDPRFPEAAGDSRVWRVRLQDENATGPPAGLTSGSPAGAWRPCKAADGSQLRVLSIALISGVSYGRGVPASTEVFSRLSPPQVHRSVAYAAYDGTSCAWARSPRRWPAQAAGAVLRCSHDCVSRARMNPSLEIAAVTQMPSCERRAAGEWGPGGVTLQPRAPILSVSRRSAARRRPRCPSRRTAAGSWFCRRPGVGWVSRSAANGRHPAAGHVCETCAGAVSSEVNVDEHSAGPRIAGELSAVAWTLQSILLKRASM